MIGVLGLIITVLGAMGGAYMMLEANIVEAATERKHIVQQIENTQKSQLMVNESLKRITQESRKEYQNQLRFLSNIVSQIQKDQNINKISIRENSLASRQVADALREFTSSMKDQTKALREISVAVARLDERMTIMERNNRNGTNSATTSKITNW